MELNFPSSFQCLYYWPLLFVVVPFISLDSLFAKMMIYLIECEGYTLHHIAYDWTVRERITLPSSRSSRPHPMTG